MNGQMNNDLSKGHQRSFLATNMEKEVEMAIIAALLVYQNEEPMEKVSESPCGRQRENGPTLSFEC